MKDSLDQSELQQFSRYSDQWWDPQGPFAPLHYMNPVRLEFIRNRICAYYNKEPGALKPLEDLRCLDIGCGGGLICEPLASMGADVTGVDADPKAIKRPGNIQNGKNSGLIISVPQAKLWALNIKAATMWFALWKLLSMSAHLAISFKAF